MLNVADIKQFFQFLNPQANNRELEVYTYCLLDKDSKTVIKGYGTLFGTVDEIIIQCEKMTVPFTLHVCLNRTKLSGRKLKDIEAPRVLCVDFDTAISPDQLDDIRIFCAPQMIVESSPAKFHFYWKISVTTLISDWKTLQLGLAHHFKADLNLAQPGHTIRVPGVERNLKIREDRIGLFMPRIVYLDSEPITRSFEDFLGLWPWIKAAAEAAQTQKKTVRKVVKTALGYTSGNRTVPADLSEAAQVAGKNGRNSTLFSLCYQFCLDTFDLPDEVLFQSTLALANEFNDELAAHGQERLPDEEVSKTVESAFSRADTQKNKESKNNRKDNIPESGYKYNFTDGPLKFGPYTEIGLKERVLQRFGSSLIRTGKIVYAFDRGEYVWRSQRGSTELLNDYVAECTVDFISEKGFLALCKDRQGKVTAQGIRHETAKWLSHRILAQTVTGVYNSPALPRKEISSFDGDARLFYCANGVLNLITGEIRKAEPTDYLLRRSKVTYDPQTSCPYFLNFLGEVFAKNKQPEKMVNYIKQLFGYSLCGDNSAQTIFVHSGDGSNGKSRLLRALRLLTGDYTRHLGANALTKNKNAVGKEVERIGAKIEGTRCVIIDDLETATQWSDQLIKTLTADTIVARNLYEEEKDIPNRAKIHIGCNETPAVESAGIAMFRRIKIIQYWRSFEPNIKMLKTIDSNIEKELSGVLNWAIEGLREIFVENDGNFDTPPEVEIRTQEYQADNEGVFIHLSEMFQAPQKTGDRYSIQDCVAHVKGWAMELKYPFAEISKIALGRRLTKLGFESKRDNERAETYYSLIKIDFKDRPNYLADKLKP